jgi:MinD-like ATPase involved in chromosome partitioning or flagellar assembly
MATIQGISYKKIVSAGVESYDLVPFDANGNLFQEVTINVDTTGGAVTITLPEIATLNNNYNCTINVVRTAGTDSVTVTAGGSDKIGSASTVVLNAINKSVVVTPIESINWYGVISA